MSSDDKVVDAASMLLPLQNSNGVRPFYGALAGPTTQVIALPTAFGNHTQHYYTLVADGGKIYAALSRVPTGSVDPGAINGTGVPTANGFPIADGGRLDGLVAGGEPRGATGISATGPATPTYLKYDYLLFRTASGVGSAYFQVWRTGMSRGGGVEEFLPPGQHRGR